MPLPLLGGTPIVDVMDPNIVYAAGCQAVARAGGFGPAVAWSPSRGTAWNSVDVTGLPSGCSSEAFAADPVIQGLLFVGAHGVYVKHLDVSPVGVGDPSQPPLAKLLASPNPFRSSTWLRVPARLDETSRSSVLVFDTAGRTVTTLTGEPHAKGVRWNGTDASGDEVPLGVYFVRVDTGGSRVTTRVVKLR